MCWKLKDGLKQEVGARGRSRTGTTVKVEGFSYQLQLSLQQEQCLFLWSGLSLCHITELVT